MPADGARPPGPPLMWLNPFALAREALDSPRPLAEVRRAIDAMPEQFLTLGGVACLQRETWYRNPWKTWAMVRCEQAGGASRLYVWYAGNPAMLLLVLLAIGVTYATLPLGDATLYVFTLGGVLALVGSFGRFVARDDVALLREALVRAAVARPGAGPAADDDAR